MLTSPAVINLGGWPLPLLVNAGLVVFSGGGFQPRGISGLSFRLSHVRGYLNFAHLPG